tara:strand:+ start:52 stop:570 length:519 start_codon:yes stop_codon:yes gene_type:complete
MQNPNLCGSLALYLLITALSINCWATEEDTEQPIRIVADSAIRDEKQGLTTYSGNVKMDQGSMSINAQSITIHSEGEGVNTIIAKGTPAFFTQYEKDQQPPVKASGNIIEYYKAKQLIHIRQQAAIEQNSSTVKSEDIKYYLNERIVKANSGEKAGRVEVVIPPRQNNNKVN